MTREQLDLLIKYINIRAEHATDHARGQTVSPYSYDKLAEIIDELEETTED